MLLNCGQPTLRAAAGMQGTGTYRWHKEFKGTGDYKEDTQIAEKWTFNCGSGDYIYVLTFVGGTLSSIDSAGRGSGKSDCGGPAR